MFKRLKTLLRPSHESPDITALQDAAVNSITADIVDLQDGGWEDREWIYLAVNHEMSAEDAQRTSTQAAVLARKPSHELEKLNFRLSPASKLKLVDLRNAMIREGGTPWTILDLSVERDGRYDFQFDYGLPPRLNGDLLHAPLSNLLSQFLSRDPKR